MENTTTNQHLVPNWLVPTKWYLKLGLIRLFICLFAICSKTYFKKNVKPFLYQFVESALNQIMNWLQFVIKCWNITHLKCRNNTEFLQRFHCFVWFICKHYAKVSGKTTVLWSFRHLCKHDGKRRCFQK